MTTKPAPCTWHSAEEGRGGTRNVFDTNFPHSWWKFCSFCCHLKRQMTVALKIQDKMGGNQAPEKDPLAPNHLNLNHAWLDSVWLDSIWVNNVPADSVQLVLHWAQWGPFWAPLGWHWRWLHPTTGCRPTSQGSAQCLCCQYKGSCSCFIHCS